MQYILSEEEYKSLKDQADENSRAVKISDKDLQKLCTNIADTMPVKWGWGLVEDPKPWGCVLTAQAEDDYTWYCDQCPVVNLCPSKEKRWSQ